MRRPLMRAVVAAAVAVSAAVGGEARAQAQQTDPAAQVQPVADVIGFKADILNHDRALDIITATGNVEINYEGRTLLADVVSYDQFNDVMSASGDVTLLEETGEVLFTDHIELSGDLRNGIAKNMRLILADGARVAANGGRRINADTELAKAVYSPCNLCEDDPEAAPLWQIKAVRVYHDREQQEIRYEDAWLELGGVPIAYTPYLEHADPTAKRKSGFLAPRFGSSSNLGTVLQVPYFVAIDDHRDATITPFMATKEGPGSLIEYRQRLIDGEMDLDGSLALDSESDIRGHVETEVRFDVDDTWRWGFDVHRATDDTYLARYGIAHPSTLESRLFAEGFRGRNYLSVESYAFQGVGSSDDPSRIPLVLPLIEYEHHGSPQTGGGRFGLEGSLVALERDGNTDTRRLSVRPYWTLPYIAPKGDVYDLTLQVRADAYHVNDHGLPTPEGTYTGVTGRVVPEASFGWRYPFVRRERTSYQVLEPIARLFASPYGGNLDTIPNEDSQEFEFDDTNLFTSNRFPGNDRIEGGVRMHYGMRWANYNNDGGRTEVLVGQSYRPRRDGTFAKNTGLEDNFSDFVGRVAVQPNAYFDLYYRTRFDKDSLDARRHEARFSAGVPAFRLSTTYLFLDAVEGSEFAGREETNIAIASQFTKEWRADFTAVRDEAAGEMRSIGTNLTYEDECLIFRATASRQFFRDRELEPEDALFFTLTFKTLGEIRTESGLL
jgi:LPS-assembly protein